MLRAKPESLPVWEARAAIVSALEKGPLLLSAPPGTGKSTGVPRFLLEGEGKVLILQPRRIAARALAARVAEELGEPLGKTAGYQVRFESVAGPETRLLFQTYGTFRQRLLRDPALAGVGAVVLDEFHERTWEADLALWWCRELRARRDLKLAVLSATLDDALEKYLPGGVRLALEGKVHSVEIRHQPPRLQEPLPRQVQRALASLVAGGWEGSALVFLPGIGEIRSTAEAVDAFCRGAALRVCELHGSLSLAAQQENLRAPAQGPAVILSTNVAETSLTVPGITAVIDAGLHRVAAYDPDRDRNTLYLQGISKANAVQRSGRAGRVAPGICIRLWDAAREAQWPAALEPEIRRLDLGEAALARHALDPEGRNPSGGWPTPPDPDRWRKAEEKLERIGALRAGRLTPLGRDLLPWPAPPELARVLTDAASGDADLKRQVAAMAAVLSSGRSGGAGTARDLFDQAEEVAEEKSRADRESLEAFRQLGRLLDNAGRGRAAPAAGAAGPGGEESLRRRATALFLPVYVHRLAARGGEGAFSLSDGRRAVGAGIRTEVGLLLALEVHESGGKDKARQATIPLYLPVLPDWVDAAFPGECRWEKAEEFDAKRGKVLREERRLFRGLILERREASAVRGGAGELLADQLRRGEIELPWDDEARQWLHRIRLAHRICPEAGLPALDDEDWELIYHDVCEGKTSVNQLREVSVSEALRRYLGPALAAFLEREAPVSVRLPQGKRQGRITYFESNPPELSARLGDFIGMKGMFKILKGRVEVVYDILAPNFRTVQKTKDLTSFWENSYPEVKKELKRRYPRHPWP